MNASRIVSRAAACSAGSAIIESGTGSSQSTSSALTSGSPAVLLGAPSPVGSGRRSVPSSEVRQTLVAIRCSHVRSDERPSNPW